MKIYLKKYARVFFLLFSCGLIFLIVFALYHIPVAAVVYPAILCAVLILLFFGWDIWKETKRARYMEGLKSLPVNLREQLEPLEEILDRDLCEIVFALEEQEKKHAWEAENKRKDMIEYYTTWVHQIKTPIASMRLTLQEEDSTFSRKVSKDLFRIEQYVEMVLTYLRLDSESTDYVFRECEVDSLLKASLRKFAGQFIGKGLKVEYAPTNYRVITDEKWLSFVLEQLLSNAVKYTTNGSVSVGMETPGILFVRDTGIGIEASDLPRVFEKGYTGFNGREDKKASGIGLYLCKQICNRLGHSIWAESVVGEGTCIRIDLRQEKTKHE